MVYIKTKKVEKEFGQIFGNFQVDNFFSRWHFGYETEWGLCINGWENCFWAFRGNEFVDRVEREVKFELKWSLEILFLGISLNIQISFQEYGRRTVNENGQTS